MGKKARVVTYYTDDRYKALADRMVASVMHFGFEAKAYARENPTGTWMAGMNLKPQVILDAMTEFPGESIFFIDADCVMLQEPKMLDEDTHDCDIAACFDEPRKPCSPIVWLKGTTTLKHVQFWVEDMKKHPGRLDDYVCLWNVMAHCKPKARVLHLPPSYAWVEEWHRSRFGPIQPVIWHDAVGEHKTIDLTWKKTSASLF